MTGRSLMLRALMLRALTLLTLALVITLVIAIPAGQAGATEHSPALADTAPAGTVISAVNWRRYARFMPAGMQAIFAGDHFWRMPSDVQIEQVTSAAKAASRRLGWEG